MSYNSTASSILPSLIAAFSGFFGSGLIIAILFGFITKLTLYFFDKEIRKIAKNTRTWFDKKRKKCTQK